jgi:hypothetical protein
LKRKLDPDLLHAMRSSVADSEDYQFAKKQGLWRPAITHAASPWVGVKEQANDNRGAYIDMIGLTVDQRHTGEAYCLSWVQTIIAFVELELNMVSPLKATEGCLDLWTSTGQHLKTTRYPVPGYIAIWQHGKGPAGHAGIVISVKDTYFKTIEANSYGPDGVTQGIFTQERLFNDSSKMKLLGFCSPF